MARVLSEVARHAGGVTVGELLAVLGIPRRTLSRRLAELVRENRLKRQGRARATRYVAVTPAATEPVPSHIELPVSRGGASVRNYVQKSTAERRPVGYRRGFLDEYVPNRSSYLSDSTRKYLHEIGRTPVPRERSAGTYARQILNRLLIDLSWASSRLEGNTYSRLDTERLIEFGQSATGKDASETQMILNHKAAIEFLVVEVEELRINRYVALNLHALLAENLLANPEAAGRLRRRPVEIAGSVFHPLSMPQVLEECFDQILDTAQAISEPYEQAFFLMVHVPCLQPFEDVNKRVSRLAANIPFIRENLCPLSFVDVPERDYVDGTLGVYELNRVDLLRDVFVWAYERSSQRYVALRQSLAEPDPFRLRYRQQIADAVAQVVRSGLLKPHDLLLEFAVKHVPKQDHERFIALALQEVERLHEGTIARYRLRPSEFEAWRKLREASE